MLQKMRRRGRPAKRRVPAKSSAPTEERMNELVNIPILPPIPPEPAGVNIPLDQMTQILATEFGQPRKLIESIERAKKLGARKYDRIREL